MTEETAATPNAEPMVWMSFALPLAAREQIKDHAHIARISASELVRRRVLGQREPRAAVPRINAETYAELRRVGNNLNQQTKLANESRQLGDAQMPQLVKVLTELKSLLDQVSMEVIGAE